MLRFGRDEADSFLIGLNKSESRLFQISRLRKLLFPKNIFNVNNIYKMTINYKYLCFGPVSHDFVADNYSMRMNLKITW